MMHIGIDEAGRGPVLGPMVIGIVAADKKTLELFKNEGVRDSKQLSIKERERLEAVIKEYAIWDTIVLSPLEIDEAIFGEGTSLNTLELTHMGRLLQKITKDLKDFHCIVDAPDRNLIRVQQAIAVESNTDSTKITATHFADRDHIIVAAASIIAKVERDRIIEHEKIKRGIDFGSGYPSDPKTKSFIQTIQKNDALVRWSWKTMLRIGHA